MRMVFVGFLGFFYPWLCHAQEMTPAVTNMAGFDGVQGGSVVTVSLGETAITTLSSAEGIVTQGFLQPEILPCVNVEFAYYPNPAIDEITIEGYGCDTRIESMQLLNMWGQVISNIGPGKENNKVNLEGYSQAVYLIKINLTSGVTKTIKVVKVAP